jgi:hypothetical protein
MHALMDRLREASERHYVRISTFGVVIMLGLPPGMGLISSSISDFGRDVHIRFFEVVAEGVLPVLLVASVVEWGLLRQERADELPPTLMKLNIRLQSLFYGYYFVLGEGFALYAVGANVATTFLLVTVLTAVALFTFDVVFNQYMRLSGSLLWLLPLRTVDRDIEMRERWLRRRLSRHERRAEELRRELDVRGQGE